MGRGDSMEEILTLDPVFNVQGVATASLVGRIESFSFVPIGISVATLQLATSARTGRIRMKPLCRSANRIWKLPKIEGGV